MTDYKLVPVEPTLDMLCEGMEVYGSEDCAEADMLGIYKATLTAAPVINIVATKNEQGQIVSVTLQDEDHHILEVIDEADVQGEPEPCQECGGDGAGGEHEDDCAMARPAEQQPAPDVAGLVEALDENEALQAECAKLRKDAERYQSLLEAVLREIPHREGRRRNAPGHCHAVPGVWDEDNGALAGKECAWCKVWSEALTAIQEHNP